MLFDSLRHIALLRSTWDYKKYFLKIKKLIKSIPLFVKKKNKKLKISWQCWVRTSKFQDTVLSVFLKKVSRQNASCYYSSLIHLRDIFEHFLINAHAHIFIESGYPQRELHTAVKSDIKYIIGKCRMFLLQELSLFKKNFHANLNSIQGRR